MAVSLILVELKYNGAPVDGDCTISGFVGHIAVDSFSWAMEAETVEKTGGKPLTTIEAKEFSIKKSYDRASTTLCKIMSSDDNVTPLEITVKYIDPTTIGKAASTNGKPLDSVLEIQLIGCHIENISLRASDSGKSVEVTEDIRFSFTESITLNYRSYDAKSRARNKPVTSLIKPTGSDEKKK